MSQRKQEIAITKLFTRIKSNDDSVSQDLLKRVNDELAVIASLSKFDNPGNILKDLREIVKLVNERNLNLARQKCKATEHFFNAYLKGHLESHYEQPRDSQTEPLPDYDQEPEDVKKDVSTEYQGVGNSQRGQTQQKATGIQAEGKHRQQENLKTGNKAGQQAMREMKPKSDAGTMATSASNQRGDSGQQRTPEPPTDRRNTSIQSDSGSGQRPVDTKNESSQGQRGQGKGDARSNTSDSKTAGSPEVLAKKFKDLYDDIWPNAHDYLRDKMKIGDEKKVVETLLKVVHDANKFCKKEAEEQISSMALECLNIVRGKPGAKKEEISKINLTLIKEFRQANAELAVPRLQKEFLEAATKSYFLSKTSAETPESLRKFCNRAVTLLWWMNLHEPPVYVCPTSSVDDYLPGTYKGCTGEIRPGDKHWYFVWPAVRLHEKGVVIQTGFVDSEIKANSQTTKL